MERSLEDDQYQLRKHEEGYSQFGMEEFDRIALEGRKYEATPEARCYYRDQYNFVQPYQEGGSHTEYNQIVRRNRKQ